MFFRALAWYGSVVKQEFNILNNYKLYMEESQENATFKLL